MTIFRNNVRSPLIVILALVSSHTYGGDFDFSYTAYAGDLDGDGQTDSLYVRQERQDDASNDDTSTPPHQFTIVDSFILRQNPDPASAPNQPFVIIYPLDSSQRASVSQWAEAPVEVFPLEFNVDVAVDVLLAGMAGVFNAAFNQIIFAGSGGAVGPPIAVTAVDEEFQRFFQEVSNWLESRYFDDAAPLITASRVFAITESPDTDVHLKNCLEQSGNKCQLEEDGVLFEWLPKNVGRGCRHLITDLYYGDAHFEAEAAITPTSLATVLDFWCAPGRAVNIVYVPDVSDVRDYTVFNQDALVFAAVLDQAMYARGGLYPGSDESVAVHEVLSKVLGAEFMKGVLVNGGVIDDSELDLSEDERASGRLNVIPWVITIGQSAASP